MSCSKLNTLSGYDSSLLNHDSGLNNDQNSSELKSDAWFFGFVLLFETGSHCIALIGLELTV